ncbi:MAG: carboxypeptidase-like regulatory domain-containing protein [Bacteroidia bacterium]
MRYRRFIFLIQLFLYSFYFLAQTESLSFRVLDSKTKTPIQFCYVVVQGKNISVQSDEDGGVKIKANIHDTLVIYQSGYYLKKVTINEINNSNNVVFLKAKDILLEEVVVKAQSIDTFEKDNGIIFLDFEFYDDNILTLISTGNKFNSLLLLDMNGNRISKKNLLVKAETLEKDCFENIHLMAKDSLYQVYYNYKTISLLKGFPIINYYNFVEPCECYFGPRYIFKTVQYRRLKNVYYLYHEKEKPSKRVLASVADSSAIKGFNMDYDLNYFLSERRKGYGYRTSVSEINKHIDQYREELPLSPNYLLWPMESEIKKIDSSFILFDYTNKARYEYSLTGELLNKIQLNDFSGISPKLYIDHDSHNLVFSSTDKNGLLTLFRYDHVSNCFTHKFELKDFHFLTNFKIKDNNIFFINKDRTSNYAGTKIIKEVIVWQAL